MSNLPSPEVTEVTALLAAWSDGDAAALAKLLPLVQGELHRLAHRYQSHERKDHTLQTTALVNEAYLRLVEQRVNWRNRAHFFAISAQIMRRILIDHARKRLGPQRGGGKPISLEEASVASDDRASELVASTTHWHNCLVWIRVRVELWSCAILADSASVR